MHDLTTCMQWWILYYFLKFNLFLFADEVPEDKAFLAHYGNLVTTLSLSNADLSPHFVSNGIITMADHYAINKSDPSEQAKNLLKPIAAALKIGYLPSFYKMLKIMKTYGNEALRELADKISQSDGVRESTLGT